MHFERAHTRRAQALKARQIAPGYWTKLSFESYCTNTVKYTQFMVYINTVGYV